MKKQKKLNIAIIGYGRFGKLFAEILQPFGSIFVVSSKKVKSKKVKQIDYLELNTIDWVIPCVPISAMEATLKKIKPFLKPKSLVFDVCSVKVWPCRWLKKHIPKNVEIIGTHPMFGPDSAKKGLDGLQVVVCPLRSSKKTLKNLENIFKKLKLKIITTTPQDHDKQVAKSLALVHFLGRGLAKANISKQEITTLGFERLLKVNETVNNDTLELFIDMNKYNPYTKIVREKLIGSLTNINKEITRS